MFKRILIANRGEIALRIIRCCREMDIETVQVYSEADRQSLPVMLATYSVCIGPAKAADSYLKEDSIIEAARKMHCDAIHPGYGFLSENAEFARKCEETGFANHKKATITTSFTVVALIPDATIRPKIINAAPRVSDVAPTCILLST